MKSKTLFLRLVWAKPMIINHSLMPFILGRLLAFFLLTTMLFCLTIPEARAQKHNKTLAYHVWIKGKKPTIRLKGFITNLTDSSVVINQNWQYQKVREKTALVEQINVIKFRKQERILRGIVIGVFTGIGAGLIWGGIKDDGKSSYISPTFGYIVYMVPCFATIGGVVGSFKTSVRINGSRSKYAKQRSRLEQFQLGY